MGQLQVINHPASSDTNSSDSYDYYQPNGVIENALRLYVDAWNVEAFLWVNEIARDDWNHWCVPAVRHQLYTTMGGGWQRCHQAAVEICNGVWRSWGGARYHSQQRISAMLLRNPQEWATFMIEQMQRLTRARRQLERMGRINCQIADPALGPNRCRWMDRHHPKILTLMGPRLKWRRRLSRRQAASPQRTKRCSTRTAKGVTPLVCIRRPSASAEAEQDAYVCPCKDIFEGNLLPVPWRHLLPVRPPGQDIFEDILQGFSKDSFEGIHHQPALAMVLP